MSLLHRGTETVTVYLPPRTVTPGPVRRLSVSCPRGRPADDIGHQTVVFETESKYWLRLVGYSGVLGAQSQVDWQSKRYAIDGDPRIYNGSRHTAHVEYVIVRR